MVNRRRNFTLHFYLMSVLVVVALGAVNYLAMEHRARLDLTGDKRFTLSEGTQRLFEKLTEPITVTYYVDAEPPSKRINLERDVRDKLEELAVSSGGKLEYRIERITNEEASERREELEELGVTPTVDVLTTGSDERAEMRGVQGYYSSLVVAYGTSEPKAINGIVNLVDQADETREHRVDTLEFDIAFNVLTMRNETQRPSFERLVRSFEKPIRLAYYITDPMPPEHAAVAINLERAMNEIAEAAPEKVMMQRVTLPPNTGQQQPYPFGPGTLTLMPFDFKRETVPDERGEPAARMLMYFSAVVIHDPNSNRFDAILDFKEQKTLSDVRSAIQERIWELSRPQTRLGIVLPPHDPRAGQQQRGSPPQNAHTPLLNYIQTQLDYDTVWVDIKGERRVPRDLACLIVLEANLLSERELYEVERFLTEGGNVILLVQGWTANLELRNPSIDRIRLTKEPAEPYFEDWLRHMGVEVKQDLLLRPGGRLQPYTIVRDNRGAYPQLVPAPARLAPVVEPKDLDSASVFTRGLAAMPLPLVVETAVDDDRLRELGLEKTELIRLKGDVHKFLPANPALPEMPPGFDIRSPAEVESNPIVEPGDGILAQKLGHDPLVAALLTGEFPGWWADDKRKIPGWSGDPENADAPPVSNPERGNLLVMGTAGTLNVDYLYGYSLNERQVAIDRGLNFYRNVAEGFIYGEDLVGLRARTGVAPRIVGPVDDKSKVIWFLICIAGVPVLLLALAGLRGAVRARQRDEYESGLGIPQREEK